MDNYSVGHDSEINNIQDFVKVIGDRNSLWSLLIGKEVTRLSEEVKYRTPPWIETHRKGSTSFKKGKVFWVEFKSILEIIIEYRNGFRVKYRKENFVKQFGEIYPPLPFQSVIKLLQQEEKKGLESHKQQEAKRDEILKQQSEKQNLIKKLRHLLQQDFLASESFYRDQCIQYISHDEYQFEKSTYVQNWVKLNLGLESDSEQAKAIGTVEGHVQVVARAGSGKTRTLVSRALFLQKHCRISPHEILLLAFNKKAANEIRDRLTDQLQSSIPYVMTFHALAYALVHPEENILLNEPDGAQRKSRALQTVIDDYLNDLDYGGKICALMKAHFREDWERIVLGGYDKSPQELLKYRRSLPKESLKGEYVKSFGEKVIADFLFEHDVNYKYECNFWWSGINYRPDFTIFTGKDQGIIIEYFGLRGDPDYDEMSDQKRKYWADKDGWQLLEFYPADLTENGVEGFYVLLKQSLENCQILCNRLSEEQIWLRIKDRAIDRFTTAMESFIQRCRKLILSTEELAEIIANHHCVNQVEQGFLELAEFFYQAYLERLQATGEEDFDGLMQRSTEVVSLGQTVFRRKSGTGDLKHLRYIMIDEYQDFSKLFHRLIEAIREQNPQVQLFCVGDDWQAINGFAGSDLSFYQNFEQLFSPASKLTITTNYRSDASIVHISNQLMEGLGTPASIHKRFTGKVEIANLSKFKPTPLELESYPGDDFTPAVLRLINGAFQNNKQVVLLSRKNNLPWYINYKEYQGKRRGKLEAFLELVRSKFPKELRKNVTISTTHKYKGLEKEVVIILDAVPRSYPLLHPDLMFTFALGDSIERAVDEERRLFYVALTRAVEHLFIFAETNNRSPFLEVLQKSKTPISSLDWSAYRPVVGKIRRITVKVSNQNGRGSSGTLAIKEQLKAEDYAWDNRLQTWWRNYLAQNFSVQMFFTNSQWISHADGIQLQFYDDLENILARYTIDAGQLKCVFDNFPAQNS